MKTQGNDGGGTTFILADGDSIEAIPDSHRDIVTDKIRTAFRDPAKCFGKIAERTSLPGLRKYLSAFIDQGRWSLVVADTYLMEHDTIAAFQWFHPSQYQCMFTPAAKSANKSPLSALFTDIEMVHWDAIAHAGGIFPQREQTILTDYIAPSNSSPIFPNGSATIFGTSPCGDMMVHNERGDAGYLSHETGASYVVGTIPEMLNWIFECLAQNQMPEFDYSRC